MATEGDCEFERVSEEEVKCSACGTKALHRGEPSKLRRNCSVETVRIFNPHLFSPKCWYRCETLDKLHYQCSKLNEIVTIDDCKTCVYRFSDEEKKQETAPMPRPARWAYGVTTVNSRLGGLLERTLESLSKAGFDKPRLFVDGVRPSKDYAQFGLETTYRFPPVRAYGNWILSLYELYIRDPIAERYAIFQDDFVTYQNLRSYLDQIPFREKTYWNLYTTPENQRLCRPGTPYGFFRSNQYGRGALALIFNRAGVIELLKSEFMILRPQDAHRGHRNIDGGVVTSMSKSGYEELTHNPTLVQHTGDFTTIGTRPKAKPETFLGEAFDALELLKCPVVKDGETVSNPPLSVSG